MKLTQRQLRRIIESNLTGDSGNEMKPVKTLTDDDNEDQNILPQQDIEVADDFDIPVDTSTVKTSRRGLIKLLVAGILSAVGYKTAGKMLSKNNDVNVDPNPNRPILRPEDIPPEIYLRFEQLIRPFFHQGDILYDKVSELYGDNLSFDDVVFILESSNHGIPYEQDIETIGEYFELPVYDSNLIIGYIKEIIQYVIDSYGDTDDTALVLWMLKEYVELEMVLSDQSVLDMIDPQ